MPHCFSVLYLFFYHVGTQNGWRVSTAPEDFCYEFQKHPSRSIQ